MSEEAIRQEVEAFMNELDENDPMDTDEIHDEVETFLSGDGPEIMELFATDPEYYLNIVQNYKRDREGNPVYLSDLCNIIVNRMGGRLHIKFKLTRDSQWYEVGFMDGNYNDEETYAAFSEKVAFALRSPLNPIRELIEETQHDTTDLVTQAREEFERQEATTTATATATVKPEPDEFIGDYVSDIDEEECFPQFEQPTSMAQPNNQSFQILSSLMQLGFQKRGMAQKRHRRFTSAIQSYLNEPQSEDAVLLGLLGNADANLRAFLYEHIMSRTS